MNTTDRPKGLFVLAVILIIFAVGTIAFWATFYTAGLVSASDRPAYLEHERSFPLADAYMVVCAFLGAAGIIRRRPSGLLYGLLAGSATIFLGLMDTLYALQQGLIHDFSFSSVETLFLCSLCLVLGPATIIYLWRNREYLL
jgi:hypothetical protein